MPISDAQDVKWWLSPKQLSASVTAQTPALNQRSAVHAMIINVMINILLINN